MGGLKLYVDDIRPCPAGWFPARTVTAAIRILDTQEVEIVSLDFDIACHKKSDGGLVYEAHASEETFEPVARFIDRLLDAGEDIEVRLHSANPDGRQIMRDIIGRDRVYDVRVGGEE